MALLLLSAYGLFPESLSFSVSLSILLISIIYNLIVLFRPASAGFFCALFSPCTPLVLKYHLDKGACRGGEGKSFGNVGLREAQGTYNIFFFLLLSFSKMTYLKIKKKTVHSYGGTKMYIYSFDCQIYTYCTIFALFCTF